MKSSVIPAICGLSLAAMAAAGLTHWWTVEQLVATLDAGMPENREAGQPAPAPLEKQRSTAQPLAQAPEESHLPAEGAAQKEFYAELLAEMKKLRTENRDLLDQMAETNRDLMKLEFRVDTHSESFRPLPVSEDRMETSFGEESGVLPPRAQPVALPSGE